MKEQRDQRYSGMKVNEAQRTVQSDLTTMAVGDELEKVFWSNKDWNVAPQT